MLARHGVYLIEGFNTIVMVASVGMYLSSGREIVNGIEDAGVHKQWMTEL